jgi:hypothetical protein
VIKQTQTNLPTLVERAFDFIATVSFVIFKAFADTSFSIALAVV